MKAVQLDDVVKKRSRLAARLFSWRRIRGEGFLLRRGKSAICRSDSIVRRVAALSALQREPVAPA